MDSGGSPLILGESLSFQSSQNFLQLGQALRAHFGRPILVNLDGLSKESYTRSPHGYRRHASPPVFSRMWEPCAAVGDVCAGVTRHLERLEKLVEDAALPEVHAEARLSISAAQNFCQIA